MSNNHPIVESTPSDIQQIIILISSQLGISKNKIPLILTPSDTSEVLDISINTLAVWRSTGRYSLPFMKVGRKIRYPIIGIAEFIIKRTITHTGGLDNEAK